MKNYDQPSSISMIGENEAYSVPRLSRHNQYGVTDLHCIKPDFTGYVATKINLE